ncbi:major facilitator superfamily domain-containing protein 6-like [Aplochiton taeniatus]
MKSNKQIDVKGALALAGAFHFLFSFGQACVLPFLTLYFRHLGLTPDMTGIIMGSKHLVSLFWRPLSSLLAKVYNKRRVVIAGSTMCSTGIALVVLLIPSTGFKTLSSYCNNSELNSGPIEGIGHNNGSEGRVMPTMTSGITHAHTDAGPVSYSVNGTFFPASLPNNDTVPALSSKATPSMADQLRPINETSPSNHSLLNAAVVSNRSGTEPVMPNSSDPHRHHHHHNHSTSIRSLTQAKSDERGNQPEREGTVAPFDLLGNLKSMDAQHQLFFLVLLLVAVWEVTSAPVEWTTDDGLFEYLDFVDASDRYGSTGMWGVLGAACGVGGVGLLVSRLSCFMGASNTPRVAVHFYCYATLTALALPVVVFLPLYLNKKRDRSNGLLKALKLVRADPRALLCAATAFLVGGASSAVDNFLLWQMEDCGATELHIGATLSLALLSRAAFPLISGWLSKLLSPGRVLTLGVSCLALQCLYYSVLWGPWSALPAQLLSCFSGGALWWAVQAQVDDVATPGAERSVRRVYQALCLDLGAALGSFSGGFVVRRFGVAWLFRGAAAGLALWCLCLPVLQWKAPRQRRINYSRLLAAEASEASDSESEQEKDWLETALDDDKSCKPYTGRKINRD